MAEITKFDVPPDQEGPVTIEIDATAATGDGPMTAEVRHKKEKKFKIIVKEKEPKNYIISFDPPNPGHYSLIVKWGEDVIVGSPIELNLNPPKNKAVTISDPPSGNLKPGESIKIGFDTTKAGRGELTSTCKAADSGDIPVTVTRRGFSFKYNVEFLPPSEDVYILSVMYAGKNVKGSPFELGINPVTVSKVAATNFTVPEECEGLVELDVCTEGAGNADLIATCKGKEVGEILVNIDIVSKNNYHLSAKTAPQPDTYTLTVKFAGQSIPNSPFTTDPIPPKADMLGIDHLGPDAPDVLKFLSSKANPTDQTRVARYSPSPLDLRGDPGVNDTYFVPTKGASYLVDKYWSDAPIHGFPYDIIILRQERLTFRGPKFTELEFPVELFVDAREAGPGELSAKCKGEKSGELEVFIEDDLAEAGDRQYIVSFRPSDYDAYTLSVFYDDIEVNINLHPEKPSDSS